MNEQQEEKCLDTYPPQPAQVGYLLIRTEYIPSGDPVAKYQDDQNQINANGEVARCVRSIVEEEGGFLRGAVVSADNNVADIIISYKVYPTDNDPDPIERIKTRIEAINITKPTYFNSSVEVKEVDKAEEKEPEFPTGLQGPP